MVTLNICFSSHLHFSDHLSAANIISRHTSRLRGLFTKCPDFPSHSWFCPSCSTHPDEVHSVTVHILYNLTQLTDLIHGAYIQAANADLLLLRQKLSPRDAGSRLGFANTVIGPTAWMALFPATTTALVSGVGLCNVCWRFTARVVSPTLNLQPPTEGTRVSISVWLLTLDLPSIGRPDITKNLSVNISYSFKIRTHAKI